MELKVNSIPDLSNEFRIKTSRSGGKGGQHVNKVETRVEIDGHPDNRNKQGPRLLKNPKIREAIDEYFHAYEMSAREVIARLSDQARGSLGDFLDIGEDYEPTLNLGKARREGKLHLLKKFKQKKVTYINKDDEETVTEWIEVELHDPQAALVHVGRYHGLFGAKGTEDDPINVQQITTIREDRDAGTRPDDDETE